jgi:hypothetical protein
MAICIGIVNTPFTLAGKACKVITSRADSHALFYDTSTSSVWEQNILFRRTQRPLRGDPRITLFECPFPVTPEALDSLVLRDVDNFCTNHKLSTIYGVRDYVGFGWRYLSKKTGWKWPLNLTHNFGGTVCSGRIRDIAFVYGWEHLGTLNDFEPSPTDIRDKLYSLGTRIVQAGTDL